MLMHKSNACGCVIIDTSCILAWLIEEGYEVYAFMADVGQEEVCVVFIQDYLSEHSFIAMAYRTS